MCSNFSENIKDFTLKFHSDELDEGSKALLKDIETLTQVDDSLLREFEKKKELEEQKKLEELKKLDEFQLQEELNKQEEERLTKRNYYKNANGKYSLFILISISISISIPIPIPIFFSRWCLIIISFFF